MISGVLENMKPLTSQLWRALPVALALACLAAPASAQTGRSGGPPTAFSTNDFGQLKWLQGKWAGTSAGEEPIYEQIRFLDDSSAELIFYRDAAFTQPTANGRLYLSAGRIYHTFGARMWSATRAGSDGIMLIPRVSANNKFQWTYVSPDAWTSTMRSGIGGHERVVVYDMKRSGR